MRKAIAILAVILIYIVVFGSLACLLLPVGNFRSLEVKSEVSVLPMSGTDPVEYLNYRPTISFRDGVFNQQESDYFFAGSYMCRFGRVAAYDSSGALLAVGTTPFLGVLLWNGKLYFNMIQFPVFLILVLAGIVNRKRFRRG